MVTRVVRNKSPEAKCDGARKAIQAEISKMEKRGVWDTSDVYSLRDLYKTPNLSECMLGRVFQIIGIKGDELADGDPERTRKARIVFQGSNVHTETGTAALELYEEISTASARSEQARLFNSAWHKVQHDTRLGPPVLSPLVRRRLVRRPTAAVIAAALL